MDQMDGWIGWIFVQFVILGPGRPSAGGPRMDRRAVTSLGVVKISRLARACGAQLGMTNDPLIQKRYVTHRLPGMTL